MSPAIKLFTPVRSRTTSTQILAFLDASQREAAQHKDGPSLVLCGPGGGKTSTITALVALLVISGVNLDRIICTTFSKTGAEEMKRRIAEILGIDPKEIKGIVSTFHALALRILTEERESVPFKLKSRIVIDRSKAKRFLRDIVGEKSKVGAARRFISEMRRSLVSPRQAAQMHDPYHAEVYRLYDLALRTEGELDFDSMVYWAVKLLEENPDVRARWQGRFKHVVVDECHDTSDDQLRLAYLLAQPSNNLMRVGDPSQRIYGWRGASSTALSGDGAKAYFLGLNYRSSQEIIDVFILLAEQDELARRLSARMRAVTKVPGLVEYEDFIDEAEEASATAAMIAESIFSGKPPENHAVLSRTRALLASIADEFEFRGLPYRWSGKNYWLSNEVQDVLAFAKLAVNPRDEQAFERVICSPAELTKHLAQYFSDAVLRTAKAHGIGPLDVRIPEGDIKKYQFKIWDRARGVLRGLLRTNAAPSTFIRQVLQQTGLDRMAEGGDEPDDFRSDNLQTLIARASRFTNLPAFLAHAEIMSRRTSAKAGVELSTIHASKGLEWDTVHVIGVSDEILPHRNAEDPEEERRLLYVALSRARRKLVVSYHKKPSTLFMLLYRAWKDRERFTNREAVSA